MPKTIIKKEAGTATEVVEADQLILTISRIMITYRITKKITTTLEIMIRGIRATIKITEILINKITEKIIAGTTIIEPTVIIRKDLINIYVEDKKTTERQLAIDTNDRLKRLSRYRLLI